MRPWRVVQVVLVGGAIGLVTLSAFAATNTVPATNAAQVGAIAITPNTLKPPECAALTLTAIKTGAGTITGTNASELVLGSAGVDSMQGAKGNDCVIGGGGNDTLRGGQGTDVCLGGPGTDTSAGGCETFIQ